MAFKMRTTKPEKGNKYYITKSAGGWSDAIVGSPKDRDCNTLSNCVGYAYGRFNEIGGYNSCKYLCPVNAENFIKYKGSLEVGMTPKLGACMVWQKGPTLSSKDGAGHVAIVERIDSETQILTSESAWGNSKAFWTQTRTKGDGNWGQDSTFTFLGFIYNPAVQDESDQNPKDLAINAGDLVSLASDSKYWTGKAVPQWVKDLTWYVKSIDKETGRVVINEDKDRKHRIQSPIDVKYLTKVEQTKTAGPIKPIDPIEPIFEEYLVKINVNALNYRKEPNSEAKINGVIRDRGIYTIVAEQIDKNNEKWGKLKSGAGWIMLKYTYKYK